MGINQIGSCRACRHSKEICPEHGVAMLDKKGSANQWVCRRFPPTAHSLVTADGQLANFSAFPMVSPEGSCGEFEAEVAQ